MELSSSTGRLHSVWTQALQTEAFQRNGIHQADLIAVLPRVRERAFQRLMQALLREKLIPPGRVQQAHGRSILPLGDEGAYLTFGSLRPGPMASWYLAGPVLLHRSPNPARELELPSDLIEQLVPLLAPIPGVEVIEQLKRELDDSFRNDSLCLAFHDNWNARLLKQTRDAHTDSLLQWLRSPDAPRNPTQLLEQWGTLGHPWHPGYKAKLGMDTREVIGCAPEFETHVRLPLVALHRGVAHTESMSEPAYPAWWRGAFPHEARTWDSALRTLGREPADFLPLPVHPFQLSTLQETFTAEIAQGQLILPDDTAIAGSPGMSFRTLWTDGADPRHAPMVKLPIALRLTSVQRTLTPRSARMGPRISRLLATIRQREPQLAQSWDFVPERHGIHVLLEPANDERARHLGVLYRDNPTSRLQRGQMAIPVGSLFVEDHTNAPLLHQWVAIAQGASDHQAALRFFQDYVATALPGLLDLYLIYGIAFEAHQQNSFMVMDDAGQPSRLLIRDFGDLRIHRPSLVRQGLTLEIHDPALTLFDDADFVRAKLLHAGFMCHLGELALLCQRHWPELDEQALWSALARQVAERFDHVRPRTEPERWQSERAAFLENPWPAKSFLRMRLARTQNDITGQMDNPLRVWIGNA